MGRSMLYKAGKVKQSLISLLLVLAVSSLCFVIYDYLDYHVAALLLLVTVSLTAMFLDIVPVLLAAVSSALIWNYFFIPPRFTFQISSAEDTLMFLMYFVIATLNAVLTFKIRQTERKVMLEEEKERTIKLYNVLHNSLSHELRTPIAAIVGATDNLQTNREKLSETDKDELLSQISIAAFRLNQQVDNLLNMSRLESGLLKPKTDWVDITELIYAVVNRIEENNITQKIHISINPDIPLFKLDKGMMEQVVFNLVNNATLYTAPGTEINIIARCNIEVLQLIIEDNGPGFPKEEIGKVFDKFYRLQQSKPGGTGLGLSIVRGFVEAMNGYVKLENLSGGGACFTIEIPAQTSYLKNLKNE